MHLIRNCSHYLGGFLSTSYTNPSAKEFQKAISQGNVDLITRLGRENLLSAPLPNGELPLNYAVRQSQQASVRTLLQLGADPNVCDDQNLNAISTAYFKGDTRLIEELLHYVTKDMEIGREIKGKGAPSKKAMQTVNSIQASQQNVLKNKEKLLNGLEKYLTLDLDQNSLIDLARVISKNKGSILHIAILTGDLKILEKLLKLDNDKYINNPDKDGLTPIHYAAALGRLDMMKMLIEGGAIVTTNDKITSPFALLAVNLNQQSPLAISKYDAMIFVCSAMLWWTQLSPATQLFDIRLRQFFQLASYSPLIFNFDKTAILYPLLSFIGMNASSISPNLSSLSLAVSTALTMKLAYQTFQGMRACWRNSSLGYGKALLKSLVVYAPKAILSINQLRGLGETFNILKSVNPMNELDELNTRDLKCLTRSLKTEQFANHCFKRSLDIYSTCSVDDSSKECTTALKSYDDYFRRADLSTYPTKCQTKSNSLNVRQLSYCEDKLTDWKKKCYTLFDWQLDPAACEKAEQAYKTAENNNFAPDYKDDFWRKIFMNDNKYFDCSTQTGKSQDCQKKYQDWKKECGIKDFSWHSTYENTMNNQQCKDAEDRFRKGVKIGFKKNDPQSKSNNNNQKKSGNQKKSSGNNDNSGGGGNWGNSKQNSNNGNSNSQQPKTTDYTNPELFRNRDKQTCKEALEQLTGSQAVTYDDAKKTYLEKALSEHPDKNTNNPKAQENFIQLGALHDFIKKCKGEGWIK